MCLNLSKNATPQIAKKDIIVYKHIKWNGTKFVTSYQDSPVFIGGIYKSELRLVDSVVKSSREIEQGLHSFKYMKTAKKEARRWNEQLVKCKIPNGSTYWKGTFAIFSLGDVSCYASDTLEYLKFLPYD